MSTGEKVKIFRLKKGMTQEQLAEAICSSRPFITQIELYDRDFSAKRLFAIAKALGCKADDLSPW